MKTYDLYGTSKLSRAELRDAVAALLGLDFEERDSGFRGGVYFRAGDLHDEHFVILANDKTDDPDEMPEPEFADTLVLLEVNATLRPEALRERLGAIPNLTLLRTKAIGGS